MMGACMLSKNLLSIKLLTLSVRLQLNSVSQRLGWESEQMTSPDFQ